jgi:large-conductance mechanosensitive channel
VTLRRRMKIPLPNSIQFFIITIILYYIVINNNNNNNNINNNNNNNKTPKQKYENCEKKIRLQVQSPWQCEVAERE